ncbi:hypothetical protein HME9302_00212 [Alteripontixanthobacter maritimus]|uniref:EF-hand domain-containing protein n=1 Tax=Alteripontixanthobacter maritimus TaxID=2161824 RepID=A0A369Q699_9SPHN|nr:EF-hand domain-containing protein [Alteripontixanthobacter maritimus]RDC59035.1 hypothetical protein HME9302_00212 [Alteripontixanthobacter maritimus]
MRKIVTTFAGAVSLGALAMGGAAAAQQTDRGAPITLQTATERADARFAKMDANGDGILDDADRAARRSARFQKMDANNDGAVTEAEMNAAREARMAQRTERMAERRANRGERADNRRGGQRYGMRGGRGGRGMAMLKRADTNNDGAVSQAEFRAMAMARFTRMDADNNGTVTAQERRAARQAMRAERMERRGNRAN